MTLLLTDLITPVINVVLITTFISKDEQEKRWWKKREKERDVWWDVTEKKNKRVLDEKQKVEGEVGQSEGMSGCMDVCENMLRPYF